MRIDKLSRKSIQKGVSLFEMIVVLAVIGVIYSGLSVLINRAMDNFNTTRLMQNVGAIQIAMLQSFKAKGSYPDIGTSKSKSIKLEESMLTTGRLTEADFVHTFGGDTGKLTIMTSEYRDRENGAFVILVDSLGSADCRLVVAAAVELFSYVEVVNTGSTKESDIYVRPTGDKGIGVIRSPLLEGGVQFDSGNVNHLNKLCPGDKVYDVYLGNY